MELSAWLGTTALLAFASYFQTVSGFGLGMIVMGLNAVFGWLTMPQAAIMVSVATLASSTVAIRGQSSRIPCIAFRATLMGLIPAVLIGVWLLHRLAAASTVWLQVLLGAMIVYGSVNLFLNPHRMGKESSPNSFVLAGFTSGIMGGLFAISGPPLIYHSYRQPWSTISIRAFLLTIFAILAVLRLAHDVLLGYLDWRLLWLSLISAPAVLGATWLGRRTAHLYAPSVLRRIAFMILLAIGLHLIAQAWPAMQQAIQAR